MLSIDCSKFSTLRKSQTNRRIPDEWVFRCPETLQKYVGLQSLDRMDGKPDVELVEPRFQCLLVMMKKFRFSGRSLASTKTRINSSL